MDSNMYAPLPTPREMYEWDRLSVEKYGVKSEMLMENASREAMSVLVEEFGPPAGKKILVFAGPGDNGGDAFALARHLHDQEADVSVLYTRPKHLYKGVKGYHMVLARKVGVRLDFLSKRSLGCVAGPDLVVDGLLGAGLKGELKDDYKEWVRFINNLGQRAHVFSLDIPSGLNGLTGAPSPIAVRASATVTFEAAKLGLVVPGADEYTGRLHVRRIGIPRAIRESNPPKRRLLNKDAAEFLPRFNPLMHKGSAGHILIIGGSPGLTGAPLLSALGALRGGSGLATVACPGGLSPQIKSGCPDVMTLPLGRGESWTPDMAQTLKDKIRDFDSLVIGPGLGRAPETFDFFREFLNLERPGCVFDADALYWLAKDIGLLKKLSARDLLTPHPGEMARMAGTGPDRIQSDRVAAAEAFVLEHKLPLALKGAGTVIASPDGKIFLSPFCSPALAVGGSGDVLAGLVASIRARNVPTIEAACLAVYWHGLCGEILGEKYPHRGNLAQEIAFSLPFALEKLLKS